MYKEDFEKERRDRERAAAKIDFLEEKVERIIESQQRKEAEQKRQIDLLMIVEAEQKQKLQEEVYVKDSQVKQYKKLVDTLQSNVKGAQEDPQHYKRLAKSQDQEETVHACTHTHVLYVHVHCTYIVCTCCLCTLRVHTCGNWC